MHLKYFLLIAWISQQSNIRFHICKDTWPHFPPPHRCVRNRKFFFRHRPQGQVYIPKQGRRQGLSILALTPGAAGHWLITCVLSPRPHTPAALSFLSLQLLHTHQVPNRSWRPQAGSPPSWVSTHLWPPLWDLSSHPLSGHVSVCVCLPGTPGMGALEGRTARVCAHSAADMVGPPEICWPDKRMKQHKTRNQCLAG